MSISAFTQLLLFVQFLRASASGFVLKSRVCGADQIAYSSYLGRELFFINGGVVDKFVFCEALKSYGANSCDFEEYPGVIQCELDLPQARLHLGRGRKLLQKHTMDKSEGNHKSNLTEDSIDNNDKPLSTSKIIGVVVPGTFAVCCVSLCAWFYGKRKPSAHTMLSKDLNSMDSISSFDRNSVSEKVYSHEKFLGSPARVPPSPMRVPQSPRFSMSPSPRLSRLGSLHLNFNQVTKATNSFSPSFRIGKGGFGTVYRAQLDDGQVVAIKRAKREHFKGLRTEFSSEVELLAKIDHRNLVRLLGYVDNGDERLIITEYVPNGTLREHLDGRRGRILDFNQRLEIAIDIAHGLTYLHLYAERQIIHRDVKSSNILLTETLRAKVADFGFARLGAVDSDESHVSTNVKGTVGYLDPEYMRTYKLTTKSDVYSFGVLLVEMLTGRRPVELKRPFEERVTLVWAFKKFDEGEVNDLVDPRLEEVVDAGILVRIFGLAIQCAAPIRTDRPDMKAVGEQLWAIRADYVRTARRGHGSKSGQVGLV
ncbi:calmodulin-binding receptor-like cytoplasmic kinase 3 [Syzygium oleosum]|uniref:calmodulin-binding receptor-like cytoplasmic kinase 3 n=1 Tax=Syzygium oleosum TaxID=219896 RepID=UPI0011D26F77|nr:calmodulin-binding receptor-like cytoplasmic kinase 3 [Syzygium oleosum]